MSAVPERYYSLDEYFTLEDSGEGKHEFYQGVIYAMTGASARHNHLAANVITSINNQLRGKPCVVYAGDLRVKIEATNLYTYPDASVICGPLQYDGTRSDTVTNPTIIIEVLSPSTEDYDRGKKFQHYRTIRSLRAYLVIAQDAMRVEYYARKDDHQWLLTEYSSPEQAIPLDAIQATVTLDEIYDKVDFDEGVTED